MNDESLYLTFSMVGGFISTLLGGYDYLIRGMLLLMGIDIVAGFVCAALFDTSKYARNGVSSKALLQGAIRKIFMLCVVSIGVVIDHVLAFNYVRNAVVIYFIGTEGISILEHLVVMEIPVPDFVLNILENMKKEGENGRSKNSEE